MGVALLVLSCFWLFIRSELVLRAAAVFGPERAMQRVTRYQPPISRKLFSLARMLGRLQTAFEGYTRPLPRVFLVISNHQSLADIPALMVTLPRNDLRFVAKKELGRGLPYISSSLRFGQHALISRKGDFGQGQKELRRFAGLAQRGICPVIFPEGTRSRTGRVGSFFAGAVRVVLEHSPIPVLSVAVDGGYRISTVPRMLNRMRGTFYRVKPLTLYPAPHGKKEITELLKRVKEEITAQVREWRREDARPAARASA